MGVGENLHLGQGGSFFAGQGIEFDDGFELVAEQGKPPSTILEMGGEQFDDVAADPERAAMKIHVVAAVLEIDQAVQEFRAAHTLPDRQRKGHARIDFGLAHAVDAGNRGDDDDVAALQQRTGRGVAHPVDLLVD